MKYNKIFHVGFLSIFTTVILLINSKNCDGYRILGIFPTTFRSHMMMFEELMKGLAKRGHQVDVISSFPQRKSYPNYTDIIVPSLMPNYSNNLTYQQFHEILQENIIHSCVSTFGNDICEAGFTQPQIQRLIKNPPTDPPYDVVMTELLTAHCFMGFGYHLKVPVIGLSPSFLPPWMNDILANPPNLAFVSNVGHNYIKNMNFLNRLKNVVYTAYSKVYFNYHTSIQSDLIKQYFGSNAPSVRELEQDLALILVNSHFSITGIKPITPAHVEVGGLHIQDDGPEIPTEDKKWLDESQSGFIYFTFGSMVTIESFPKDTIENIYESFRKIAPIRVFMKVIHPHLLPPGLPRNVRTFSWVSQLKVLKHKNIRGFITHGGLLSTLEAISCGVPMIGVPLFYDQSKNIDRYVDMNIAVLLDYHELTESNLDLALNDILHNPIYSKAAKNISKQFLDRPLSPMDEACYWVEYVIRYGNKALRSPALDFSWWQIELLDVYFTILIFSIVVIFIFIYVIQFFIKIVDKTNVNKCESKKYN